MFLLTPGRRIHDYAKDFRPISHYFQDIHLRVIPEDTLSNAQYVYIKGRSTETALHQVINVIEKSLHHKQYTMAAFLDTEGAFNKIEISKIINSLSHGDIDVLMNRMIASNGSATHSSYVSRGTP